MSDRDARLALRTWRADPTPEHASALAHAWERAGLFGGEPEVPNAPEARLRRISGSAAEMVYPRGRVLFSYDVLVAVTHRDGIAWSRDRAYSRTSVRHVRQWADGQNLVEVSPGELNRLAQEVSA